MKNWKVKNIYIFLLTFTAVILLTAVPFMQVNNSFLEEAENSDKAEMSDAWFYEDGTSVNLLNFDEDYYQDDKILITAYLPDDFRAYERLCFRSKNVLFHVYLNGQSLYQYEGVDNVKLFGKSEGAKFHMIDLNRGLQGDEIQIEMRPIYSVDTCFFDSMQVCNAGSYVYNLIRSGITSVGCSLVLAVIGIILLVLTLVSKDYATDKSGMYSLSAICVVGGVWTGTESAIVQFMSNYQPWWHLANYYMLMLGAYPITLFVSAILKREKRLECSIMAIISAANMAVCFILNITKVLDYHESIFITHICLAIAGILSLEIIIRSLYENRRKQADGQYRYFLFCSMGVDYSCAFFHSICAKRYADNG